jgi:GR25 family glycosyltransferase involved in LPS biosynthesis
MININNIKSYLINLDKYQEKYNESLNRLKKLNIVPDRFSAIYVDNPNDEYIKKITYPSIQYTIQHGRYSHNNIGSKGAIGCYLSHVTLWKMLLESKEDMFLIFEDDVDTQFDDVKEINTFINSINDNFDWDFIYLGYNNKYHTGNKINKIIYGTHSYIINRKGAEKLLNNAFPIVDQIDSFISFMGINRDVNIYLPEYSFFIQNNLGMSSIQLDKSIRPYITQFNDNYIIKIIGLFSLFILMLLYMINFYYSKCT